MKEIYYDILSPDVIKVRDEKICMLDSDYIAFYHDGSRNSFSRDEMNLMLQTIEVLEKENPTINHEVLLEEIEQFRLSNGLYPMFKDDNVKQLSKKMFPDYYKALKL